MKISARYVFALALLVTAFSASFSGVTSAFTASLIHDPRSPIITSTDLLVQPMFEGEANLSEYLVEVRKKGAKAHRNKKKGKRPKYKKQSKKHAKKREKWRKETSKAYRKKEKKQWKKQSKKYAKKREKWRKNARRRYWGAVVGGVVLGATIRAAAANQVPARPSPDLCWTWTDPLATQGYWYYCIEPD